MPTRLSQLFVRTLRDDPAEAEATSHRLLLRAGYIRRQAPGIFAWLPLGLRVKRKIEAIVRQEMASIGAQEVHFPALLPREPYEASGRWADYGPGIFRLKDRNDADYLLAPTHEEVFTLLVKDMYSSYKDFPLAVYQIQDKYRDEVRPRAGLLRGREFTMKDAYTFDVTDEGLEASYRAQRGAYERIFDRLGLDYVIVQADAGAMGGSRSEEFLHPTPVGEDTFVFSKGGYAANVEAYETPVPESRPARDLPVPVEFESPGANTIATLVDFLNREHARDDGRPWSAADTLKHVVLALTDSDGSRELVVVGLPGDRAVDLKRAEARCAPRTVEAATDADFAQNPALVKGYIGPWSASHAVFGAESGPRIRYLVDPRVVEGTEWVTGANTVDTHVRGLVSGRDFVADGTIDVADVRTGDLAPDGSGPIATARGMEIGHVFQLGRKYAEALGLRVLDEHGTRKTVTMGSYGIGITRILAIIAEANNDDRGLAWPQAVSPFDVHVVAAGKDSVVFALADEVISELEALKLEVLFDDRVAVSPGVKFGDAELIGVPHIVVVGRDATDRVVELWDRRGDTRESLGVDDVRERFAASAS